MKLIVTADIHIHPYRTFSTLTEKGVPDRLLLYEELAKDIATIGKDNGAKVVVLAGDIVTSETINPAVSHVLANFLDTLTDSFEATFMINGNHDLDDNVALEYASILDPFSKLPGVFYDNKDTTIDYGGLKIYLHNYKVDEKIRFKPKLKADILVAHGIVSGVTSPSGFLFRRGFNVDELIKKYKFSIIGDIHKAELLKERVLIPGVPMQADFRDSPSTGVWLVETDDWSAKYIPITSDKYHRFIVTDDDTAESKPNLHIRKKKKFSKSKKGKENEVQTTSKNIYDMFNTIIDSSTRVDKDKVRELGMGILQRAREGTESTATSTYHLKSIKLKGILSVTDEIELNVTDGSLLIVGDNGVGKSSVLAALGWLLFDEVPASMLYRGSQKMYKDEIVNDSSKEAKVSATFFDEEGKEITVSRTRSKEGKSTVDNEIILDKEGFFNFVYFDAQNRVTLLGGSTPVVQEDYISKIGELGMIQNAKAISNSIKSQVVKDIDSIEMEVNSRTNRKSQFESVEKEIAVKVPEYSSVTNKSLLKSHLLNSYAVETKGEVYTEEDSKKYEEYSRKYSMLQSEYYQLKDYLIGLKTDTKCKCCGQELPKDSIDSKVKSTVEKMKIMSSKMVDLPELIENSKLAFELSKKLEVVDSFESTLALIQSDKDFLATVNTGLNEKKDELDRYKYLRDIFNTKLPAAAMKSVADEINEELEVMLEPSNVKIHIDTFNYGKSGSITPGILIEASFNNEPMRRYVRLSGAQKRICDLSLMVCLNNMYVESMGGLSILLFDEVFSYLGDNLAEVAIEILEHSRASSKLIVTHDLRLIPHFTNKCIVYNEKGTKFKVPENGEVVIGEN